MEFCRSSASRRSHTACHLFGAIGEGVGCVAHGQKTVPMYTSLDIEKHGRVVVEDIVKLLLVQLQPLTGETQAT